MILATSMTTFWSSDRLFADELHDLRQRVFLL